MPKQYQRTIITFIAIAVLVFSFPSMNHAQTSCGNGICPDDASIQERTLRIGYTQFPPYAWTNTSGVAEGYMIDLIRLVLEPQGYSIRFVSHDNPSQMLGSLSAGTIDATTPLSISPERQSLGLFSKPIHTFNFTVFTLNDAPPIADIAALSGVRVGVSAGSQANALIDQIEGAIPIPLESGADLLLPLLKGDVEAIVAPEETILHTVKLAGLSDRVARASVSLRSASAGFLLDDDMTDFVRELNWAIDQATSNGSISELRSTWFAPGQNPMTQRESMALALTVLIAISVGVYGFWFRSGVNNHTRALDERFGHLQDIMNLTGVAVLICDEELKHAWWNDPYKEAFPERIQLLESGADLEQVISHQSLRSRLIGKSSEIQNLKTAEQFIELLAEEDDSCCVERTEDGRVFESRYALLTSGHLGVLATDITALAEAKEAIESTAAELKDANRQLREFSNVAAHDLAGPLRSIQNLHSWIREDLAELNVELGPETQENFTHIDRLIQRQSALIQDLLAYSHTDNLSRSAEFDPLERMDAIIDLSSLPDGMKVIAPHTMPRLSGDPIGFDIVLRNLISNAGKHHDRDTGEIRISCTVVDSFARISVKDDGPGIEPQYLEKIFEPFQSLRPKEHGGGTGLGLSFVAQAVARWGGSVNLSSDRTARETVFWFTVPLAETRVSDGKVVRMRANALG